MKQAYIWTKDGMIPNKNGDWFKKESKPAPKKKTKK